MCIKCCESGFGVGIWKQFSKDFFNFPNYITINTKKNLSFSDGEGGHTVLSDNVGYHDESRKNKRVKS